MLADEFTLLRELLATDPAIRLPVKAQALKRVKHQGVVFAAQHASYDNSNVMFRRSDNNLVPGTIVNILVHERRRGDFRVSETFVVVQRYIRVEAELQAPFRTFCAWFNAQLCLEAPRPELMLVRLSDVKHHFASYAYFDEAAAERRMVVWPLDRVRHWTLNVNVLMSLIELALTTVLRACPSLSLLKLQ